MAGPPGAPASDRGARVAREIGTMYAELTEGYDRPLRVSELVYAAAERFPGLLPTRRAMQAERALAQKDKAGLEIEQGDFVAHVLADPRAGAHLIHAMSQPKAEAVVRLGEFNRWGTLDLGPVRVDRDGRLGVITLQNHEFLNAEDDASTGALETAIDLVLLDDVLEVGVLRGGPATHPRHAGRRIFGSGLNLTHLYQGQISLIKSMLERELGAVGKLYRGHDVAAFGAPGPERRREKPWIAVVESFAIGGACEWLLVMDRVIAESSSYFSLPAAREGLIPGCANLRLPRLVGDALAREVILFDRVLRADEPEGRLVAGDVVPAAEIDRAVARAAAQLTGPGAASMLANRRALRLAAEPLDVFRRYLSAYARDQARCLHSAALIENLERAWIVQRRT